VNSQNALAKDSDRELPAGLLDHAPIPLLGLLGKAGSGKTSIIRFLTGSDDAEIGAGFQPRTKFSRLFSFPDDQVPIVQFLDTRGLGEADYDATADIRDFDERAHLVVVTVRACDQATAELIEVLRQIRQANPIRPVLLALTCLHDLYPGKPHPQPDPFAQAAGTQLIQRGNSWRNRTGAGAVFTDRLRPLPESLPSEIRRALQAQLDRFATLVDDYIVIDLTPEDDGFQPPAFGGERLKTALMDLLPRAYRQSLLRLTEVNRAFAEVHRRQAGAIILAHSSLAASAAAVPLPWLDIPLVLGIQSRLARKLAKLNHQQLDAQTLAAVSAAIGGRLALRMGLRSALKVIPWVGMAANAAATFAITYASGWSWHWYFEQRNQGHLPSAQELRQVYQEQLKRGEQFWKISDK